jgi:alkanesulfonate monooxygenase SsuD/methylene tetrahydromethanopterin reductase-like flavin-dependent oxidoreductase (luciferase family)
MTSAKFAALATKPKPAVFVGRTALKREEKTEKDPSGTQLVSGPRIYRNPELLADMARTLDHVSDGRMYLAVGAGWFERDYDEYGYEFGTVGSRLRQLEADLPRMINRLAKLNPGVVGSLPLLIGGSGKKVTLRLVAEYADAWNCFGPPENVAELSGILDEWCGKVGRDPREVERTVAISPDDVEDIGRYLDAGASHVIVGLGHPFDMTPLERLIEQRNALNA